MFRTKYYKIYLQKINNIFYITDLNENHIFYYFAYISSLFVTIYKGFKDKILIDR